MARQLTITLPDDVYDRLQDRFGPDQISSFIEKLLTPYVVTDEELEAGYRAMAADEEHEREALEWIEFAPEDALNHSEW
ncbi:MAG TPA: addiction module antitoxin [Chloroflexota bacterium]|nr:addiction module antitoxin [Chloroflexota bacterium]